MFIDNKTFEIVFRPKVTDRGKVCGLPRYVADGFNS